jgi:hypothetical protein
MEILCTTLRERDMDMEYIMNGFDQAEVNSQQLGHQNLCINIAENMKMIAEKSAHINTLIA